MQKSKRKRDERTSSLLDTLTFAVPLEFVSPHSLDECASRLRSLEKKRGSFLDIREVQVEYEAGDGICKFHIYESDKDLATLEAKGIVSQVGVESSLVEGKVTFGALSYIVLFALATTTLACLLLSFRPIGDAPIFGCCIVPSLSLVTGILVYSMFQRRDRFIELIQDRLDAQFPNY